MDDDEWNSAPAVLQYKAVRLIVSLDGAHDRLATGFLRREGGDVYLYTCWHVVTGYDPFEAIGDVKPFRPRLVAELPAYHEQGGYWILGADTRRVEIPLYDAERQPLWWQDSVRRDDIFLEGIGLHRPLRHDAVKIRFPPEIPLAPAQLIPDSTWLNEEPRVGEKLLIAGYPYGFSATDTPYPVVLTRFVASDRFGDRDDYMLIDSAGIEAMSGAPVFVERRSLLLVGVYCGEIYVKPGYDRKVNALGGISILHEVFRGSDAFVPATNTRLASSD